MKEKLENYCRMFDSDDFNPPPSLRGSQSPPGHDNFSMPDNKNMAVDAVGDECETDEVLSRHWRKSIKHQWVVSDSEEELAHMENEGSSDVEVVASDDDDDDKVDVVDWDALEQECGLSAWDRLGEGYEADAAQIGLFSPYPRFFLYLQNTCS